MRPFEIAVLIVFIAPFLERIRDNRDVRVLGRPSFGVGYILVRNAPQPRPRVIGFVVVTLVLALRRVALPRDGPLVLHLPEQPTFVGIELDPFCTILRTSRWPQISRD